MCATYRSHLNLDLCNVAPVNAGIDEDRRRHTCGTLHTIDHPCVLEEDSRAGWSNWWDCCLLGAGRRDYPRTCWWEEMDGETARQSPVFMQGPGK